MSIWLVRYDSMHLQRRVAWKQSKLIYCFSEFSTGHLNGYIRDIYDSRMEIGHFKLSFSAVSSILSEGT